MFCVPAVLASPPLRAEAPSAAIAVDPGDNPLVINGRLDPQTTSFAGNVRLTADKDVSRLLILATDLRLAGASVVDRTNIVIASGINLSKGQPQDVRVTVSHVPRAGEYDGQLTFLAPGKPVAEGRTIKLKLRIQRPCEGCRLAFRPEDVPLVIRGIWDANTSAFSGYVRVTAYGGDVGDLQVQSSDLADATATIRIQLALAP
jgi:hypothetical protein